MIKVTAISEAEMEDVLYITGLGIVFAGLPEGGPGTLGIQAAHGATRSFFVMRFQGEFSGWRLEGGDKEARRLRYVAWLEKLKANAELKVVMEQ